MGLPATLISTLELAKLSETVNLALVKIPKSQGGDLTLAGTLVPLFRKTNNNNNNGRRQDVTHTESQDLGSRAVQIQGPETNTQGPAQEVLPAAVVLTVSTYSQSE